MTALLEQPPRPYAVVPATAPTEARKPSGLWKIAASGDITDSWSALIGGAQGRADELLANAEKLITETKVPDVNIVRKNVAPGVFRAMLGTRRDFLVISHRGNSRLKPFQMFLGARDYGLNLDVYWYVMHRPTILQQIFAVLLWIPFVNLLFLPILLMRKMGGHGVTDRGTLGLDLFDESDLRAYVTNAHHCMLDALDKVLLSMNIDPSKIERKSRGFLGIS